MSSAGGSSEGSSLVQQTFALLKRGLIKTLRWRVSSFIRLVVVPVTTFGFVIWALRSDYLLKAESLLDKMVLILTAFQFYLFGSWLSIDKETGFKSLMVSMGLKKVSYYIANTLIILVSILPIMWFAAGVCIIYLFKDSLIGSYNIIILCTLFAFQFSAYVHFWSSFITKSGLAPILLIPLTCEIFAHNGVLLMMDFAGESSYSLVLFFGSLSPYEAFKIYCDSYLLCKNCNDSPNYNRPFEVVSEPAYQLYAGMIFWTIFFNLFAYWFDEVCPYKSDGEIKHPLFCFGLGDAKSSDSNGDINKELDPNYFEPLSSNNREIGIEVNKLTKTYNKVPVVNDLSFKVYKGETTLLLGHNGAGKTTLMNMMLSHVTPDQGEVSLGSRKNYAAIGLCPQNSILDDNLTVREHLELFCSIKRSGMSGEERVSHIKKTLEDVGLANHAGKVPGKLSGGMKRKLSLGMAFVGQSSILILDEPSSGLDPDSRVFVWNAIRRYRGDRTVLLSTQHMEEADYLGDRIAIMSAGSIICCGSSIFLNNTFGAGYKLRVECDASTKQDVLRFIRDYFGAAKIVGEDGMVQNRKDATVDFVVELSGDKSQDLEAKLIAMLEKIEEDGGRSLKIRSHGLRSSSIEDVMLNTSSWMRSSESAPKESVQLTIDSNDHLSNLTNSPQAVESQARILWALLIKHLQVYRSDWFSIICFRVLVSTFCIWYKVRYYEWAYMFDPKFLYCLMVLHYIQLPMLERQSGFKMVQLASNTTIKHYWLSQLMVDSLSFLFNVIVMNIVWPVSYQKLYIASRLSVHLISSAAIFMYSLSGAMLAYVLASILPQTRSAIGIYVAFYSTSICAGIMAMVVILVTSADMILKKTVDRIFLAILPSDAYQFVMYGLQKDCYIKSYDIQECHPTNSFFSTVVIGFLALAGQILVYGLLLFLIETKRINLTGLFKNPFKKTESKPINLNRQPDQDVVAESTKAARLIERVPDPSYSLVASNLSKSYVRGVKVIDKLSFTVEKGECFGLLGVNGAGKSTTFAMVVAEIRPDSGRIWLNGHYNNTDNADQYRSTLGYDPQPNPDIALTPVQALTLMARLRQVEEQSIPGLVESLLEVLDMAEHGHKLARNLSGGTKRKLGLGMSLIGNPLLLALDEPTAGVDPLARRGIWRLLRQLRTQSGASILISSHAMEECEAICDRISIMARGRIRCIGTFLHLRNKFSQGCSIRVQFSSALDKSQVSSIIMSLNDRLILTLGRSAARLTDTNVNSATFNIVDDRVRRSQLFKILREFREKNPAMSYMVNDSSLEDIFLTMAKEQQEAGETNEAPEASLDTFHL